uniref:Uncharacterized protein n=1 Tax=Arundo donax TaxID=35708 RepID=A0A0A8ZP47_ARUDO
MCCWSDIISAVRLQYLLNKCVLLIRFTITNI